MPVKIKPTVTGKVRKLVKSKALFSFFWACAKFCLATKEASCGKSTVVIDTTKTPKMSQGSIRVAKRTNFILFLSLSPTSEVKDELEGEYYVTEVKKLKKKDLYTFFLEKNFYYYDNWTDLYLVTAVRSSEKPTKILRLQLASLRGKTEVVWDDPAFIEQVETLDEK